jgi:hypothetical protein
MADFGSIDTDGDGQLSYEEVKIAATKVFAARRMGGRLNAVGRRRVLQWLRRGNLRSRRAVRDKQTDWAVQAHGSDVADLVVANLVRLLDVDKYAYAAFALVLRTRTRTPKQRQRA